MEKDILIESHPSQYGGQVFLIRLNRPTARNAISRSLLYSLQSSIDEIQKQNNTRALLITGSGKSKNAAFCAGADLKERTEMSEKEVFAFLDSLNSFFLNLEALPFPVIALINGYAFGGGLEMALSCDFRIASKTAIMGLTETSLGIIPGAGGTQRLSRLAGIQTAKELIFTAKKVSADEAYRLGFVNRVVAPELLETKGLELSNEIAKNAPIAVSMAKKSIEEGFLLDLKEGLKIERRYYTKTLTTKDRKEALAAFKEKRSPLFFGH